MQMDHIIKSTPIIKQCELFLINIIIDYFYPCFIRPPDGIDYEQFQDMKYCNQSYLFFHTVQDNDLLFFVYITLGLVATLRLQLAQIAETPLCEPGCISS